MNSLPNSSHSVALGIFIPSFSRFLLKFNFTKRYALALCATIILLFTTGRANGQTQFWSDTFEDTNAPSAGTRTASLNTGGPSVPYAYYFLRTDGTNLNLQAPFPGDNFTTYQNVQGSKFWAGEDTDRVRSGVTDVNDKVQKIEWTGINISGKSGMSFKGLFASHRSMGWQNIVFGANYDFLRVEYSIDGGAWTRIGSFVGDASSTNAGYLKEDTDDNKIGDGTELNKTFQEFSWPITGTGTTMSLRFTVSADASVTQEFAIDNFRLFESAAPAPSFTAQPSNSSVCAGSNSTFSVTASNATSYQWQVSTNGGSTFNALSNNSPYSGVTTTTLTITGATAGLNAYQYKCVATGSGSATSNAATLTVNSAPSISSHPVNSTICAGSNTTFGVTASNALSYQWQVDQGAGFSNITNNATYSGATTSTLTITAASASLSGYSYRVIATGTCSPVAASSAATLIVNAAPNISSHPSNSSITAGSSTTFTTTASGVTSYQWQINTGSGFSNITNGAPYSGATTATLTISNATVGLNSYQYRVIASGTCTPAATSNAATLTVASAGTLETFPSIGNNASAFTNGVSGMKYTFTGSLHGTIYANLGHNADDFIVSNDGNCLSAAGTVGSIKSATAGYMKIKSLWVFPSSNCNTVTNGGAVTFTGRKSGVDVYTVTLPSASINTLQSNNQGFTLVDFSSTANGNSNVTNIEVDEIMVAVGGTLRYAAIDDITYTFAPLTQSTNVSFASTTTTTSTASWVNGTGTSRAVFMRAASSGTATPVNNTTYTANAIFGSGTQIGATGWFCVYKGTGTSVNITGLTAGTSYQVMTIEYNGAVGSEQYQTTTATNNPTTLTTTAAPVAVSLSTSPTLTFTSGDGMSTMAVDGNGNSATISDLDLQIFAGDKSTGVYSTGATMRWENDQYLSSPNGFNGITPGPDPATTLNGFSALVIKSSSQAANFSLKSIQLQDWGAVGPVRIAGYNNGTLVGFVSTTLPSNGDGVTKNQSGELTPAYFNDIDEVRIFSNSVNIYVAVNNIQVGTPIATAVPTITSATYNASTGVLAVTGANMITGDTIDPTKLSIAGQGGTYTLTSGNVTASSATAVSITLNAADRLNINGILNNNGTSAVDVTAYNLAAAANWNATTTSAADLTGNAITVSNVSAPTITSATYDASTNVLSVTGTGLVKTVGATNDITVSKLTITGNNGITRTLTTTGNVEVTSATSFSVTLSGADIAAVSALLNKNGISSISNTTYNLSAADDWNSVITGGNIADLIANGITVSNVSITGPTASANAQTNVLCFGGSNGSATVLASGGTGPYTYSWAPSGGTAATATGLVAGTYTVTVTDANNLQATQNFTITEPASAISLTAGSQTNISCFGGSNGTASVSPTGGTPGYTYSWAPSGGTAATATGLVAGSYTVTVTDANGCQATKTFTITEPASAISLSAGSQTNISCFGGSNGTASVSPTGGTPGYTYSWAPSGGTAATATGLVAGSYTVTVTDANGCQATKTFTITEPASAISLSAGSQTNISCFGGSNGTASVSPTGGTPGYTYSWAPSGGTAATATGLVAGSYTVTITDANGCQATKTFTITEPASAISLSAGSQTNISCFGGSNGTASVSPTGGTPGYTYSWAPSGGTAATATGLVAGSYTVTVTDANGCQATKTFTITQPASAISLSAGSQTNISCFGGSNGTASVSPTGGTPGYTYSWAPSGGTAATATGLVAGSYTVTITDANGCQATKTFTITQPASAISLTAGSQTNISCFGGSNGTASVSPTGGTPGYTYSWAPSGGTAATATGLVAGSYTVTVTDANGCQATKTFTITEPASAISLSAGSQTNISCFGGSNGTASVSPTGGTPGYTYSWAPSGGTAATATGLVAGTYTVTVTDANGCQATKTFTITQPASAISLTAGSQTNISCFGGSNGTASVSPTGGTPGYTYSWAPSGGTAATATGLVAGSYTVTVTDANGCQATKTFTITQPASAISLTAGSQTNISCFGGSNGTASVSPTGGTPGYTYSWAPSGGTAATATGLVAGSYTVTVTDANGCQATKTFTITQPNAVALASATLIDATVGVNYTHNFVATGGSGSYMYDISAGSLPAGLTLNTNGSLSGTPSVAGTFNFSVRATESGCSQSTSTSYQLNINKGSQSITFSALPNKTYGDAPFLLSSSSSSGLTTTYVSSNTAVATIIGNSLTIVGAGNTTITASQVGDGNYNGAVAVDQVLSVGKKSITVTAAAKTKTYGDVDPLLTYTFSPVLVTGDDFTGSLSRTLGENIGTYAIGQGTLALSSNYILNYTGADLTIGKKTITVTATAKTKTYGDVDPALAYTFAPALVTGDSFTGGLTRAVGENIGNYAIGQGTLALNPNYTLNYTGADLSIGKKTITVTATANTKIFGDVDPVLAYTFSPALVTGDSFTGSLTRAVGENIGSYTITQGSLALNSNYTLAYVSANFSIGKKTIAVTATAKTKTYGEADPALTYTFAPALVTGDSFAGSLSRATGENVGAYAIGQGTLALSSNYTLNYTEADLSISKKAIAVTATAKTKIYGEADPALTYTFAPALVTGDSFTGSLARATGENVGDYAIGQGNLALSTNYTLNYTAANLSITKKTVAVTAVAKAKTFGDTDPAFTYTFAPALVTGDSFTGSLTRAAGENIGDYTIGQGTLALSMNYTLTFTSSKLTIGKKTIDVVAVAASKLYGERDPVFTYTFSPDLVKGDSFIGILKRAPGENVGTYAINQGTIAVTPNYQLLFAPANLTIGKVTVNVAMASKSKVYGDIDPELTYTYSPALVSGDNFSGAPSRTPGENVGTYTIGSGTLSLNENYDVQYSPGTLSISPKALTVAADANSKIYGDADPLLTYKVGAGLVNGDMLTGSLTRTAGENAGNYPILQGTLNGNGNYAISFTGNVLGINKKPLLISADNKSRGQGIANPPLTASYSGFIAGENNSVLSVQPVLSTTAVESSAKGSYPITIGGASAANYTIGYLNGTLTVLEGSISDIVLTSTPLYENAALNTGFGQLRTVADNPLSLFTYSLVSGNGSTDNALFNISGNFVRVAALLDYETKANYSIRVRSIDQNGLSFEKVFTITLIDVNEAPTLNALVDRAICTTPTDQIINLTGITPGPESGQTVTLGVSSSNTSMFSSLTVTKGTGTAGTLSYRLAPGAQGTVVITITATDNGGISFGGTESVIQRFVLTVNALPAPSIASDKGSAIFKGETAVLTASGGTSYVWANANGIVSGQNTAILTVKPEANTTYTVTATNASGCTETKTFTLTVTDLPIERGATVQATNIMSPNGDGVNDTWVIEDIQLFPNNSVRIVDRAGRLVYEKKGYDNSWDATLRGAPLAEGTYYYIIDFGDGKTIKKGFITILRK